jgi:hypothetical protein
MINDCPVAVGVEDPHKFWMCRSLATLGKPRLPRLIRVEASNTAGRVHQLQAFFLFLRGRHYTFVYLAA